MIEIDFQDFHDQNYEETGYELYVMKNGLGDVLYVGISKWSIWERWFGWSGHMVWLDNLVNCVNLCKDEFHNSPSPDISFIEPIMINKLSPILNVSCNIQPGKETTPKSKKEIEREKLLDEAYRKIFEKRER